ncbi:MAG TPA: RES family NAD+ phosphorylase [Longimicrobiales bacterium]|nr:RES family NAD+ phosphorylase [Longimicrobiales bacterium]
MSDVVALPAEVPGTDLRWRRSVRLVPTRFPPVDIFERIASPADWESLIELESLTNARLLDEVGQLSLVPVADRVIGPGASYVMAPFTHLAPEGGRFTTAEFGGYYTARELETAVAETRYHRERFLAATREAPIEIDMRVLEADLDARVADLRGLRERHPALYDPDDYTASQAFGRALHGSGGDGVAWDSVRREGGQCAVAYRPRLVQRCREVRTLTYRWNGERVDHVYEKRPFGGRRK